MSNKPANTPVIKNMEDINELRNQLEQVKAALEGKNAENAKLYKWINKLKKQINDLEIEILDAEVRIESQNIVINAQAQQIGGTTPPEVPAEEIPEVPNEPES